ncbi:hypothetical protein HD600_001976 [Microbacterium ginsengiterrae]|uniref:Uncharacterized protein n=1 Tax=Microbacterium ginsengiterrae TaxID=546115 RepID=A0A7W9CDB1_9MICO|nr:hypothetical protein [Microbacterium ginsengiterrae]MBB5743479.1 hypothetical protein [Microbacterium ginsengiterrae]
MGARMQLRARGTVALIVAALLIIVGVGVSLLVSDVVDTASVGVGAPEDDGADDLTMAWCARVLLVLAVAWLVIGMLAARTRLVRRPGAAAARASWVSATRPWRAVESMLGMLPADRLLLVSVPAALLVATRAVQTSLTDWAHLVVILVAWLAFLAVTILIARRRSPWALIATVGGVIVLRCVVTLAALAVAGPVGVRAALWNEPFLRSAYITIAFTLFVWLFVATAWALSLRWGRRRSWGIVLLGAGAGLTLSAAVAALAGVGAATGPAGAASALFPWALGPALDAAGYVDGTASSALVALLSGVGVCVLGALLALPPRNAVD